MEQLKKNLKTSSKIVLALAILSLINILFELFFGELSEALRAAALPEGAPDNIRLVTQILVLVISVVLLLPQFYIGVKGLKIAKNPDGSRAHITWGYVLIAFTLLELLTPLLALIGGSGDAFGESAEFLSVAVDVFVLYEYVKFAKAVREAV